MRRRDWNWISRRRPVGAVAFLLGALLLPAPSGAQEEETTVRGVVLERGTDRPLASALVSVEGHDRWAVADEQGRFRIESLPRTELLLRVELLGYRTELIPFDPDEGAEGLEIRLDPDPVVLEGLEVVFDRLEDRSRRYPGSVRALRGDELRETAAWNMEDIVNQRLVPLVDCGGTRPCVRRRGSTIRARVFVDEVERPDGAAWLQDLPPEAVHAVEVYDNGRQIRIYTNRFMNQLARNPGLLMPHVIVW